MKLLFVMLFALLMSPAAVADIYSCLAPANPARGLTADIKVELSPAEVGGILYLEIADSKRQAGVVTDITVLEAHDPQMTEAFLAILGLIAAEDVSGVKSTDLSRITSIKAYSAQDLNGEEVFIYQLFAGTDAIGGSLIMAGNGTACY